MIMNINDINKNVKLYAKLLEDAKKEGNYLLYERNLIIYNSYKKLQDKYYKKGE